MNVQAILLDFYQATNGQNWNNKWDVSDSNFCNWYGLICQGNDIQAIDLLNNNLGGSIPSSLGLLTTLNEIKIGDQLSSSIPTSLVLIPNLHVLVIDVGWGTLTGSIPSFPNLQQLSISTGTWGLLTGTIPSSLNTLTYFQVSGGFNNANGLTGTIPSSLTQLSYLNLPNNHLKGTIPSTLGMVTFLNLQKNQLSGTISSTLRSLSFLNLEYNLLTGSIPPSIINSNLKSLILSSNRLNGTIPSPLICALSDYGSIQLNNNQLTGRIPTIDSNNNAFLRSIYLNNNLLTGPIPSSIGTLTYLETIDFTNNQLSGTIPSSLAYPSYECYSEGCGSIRLGNNKLTGLIPSFGYYSQNFLRNIYLNDNLLTGSIPSSFGTLTQLWTLSLSSNRLVGSIPSSLQLLNSSLSSVELSSNFLTGPVPFFPNALKLAVLRLSNNSFSGFLPTNTHSLIVFTCDHNQNIIGTIPSSFVSLQSLSTFHISHTSISCYPSQLIVSDTDFDSTLLPLCPDDQSLALWDLQQAFGIHQLLDAITQIKTGYFESPHPFPDPSFDDPEGSIWNFEYQVAEPGAFEYNVQMDPHSVFFKVINKFSFTNPLDFWGVDLNCNWRSCPCYIKPLNFSILSDVLNFQLNFDRRYPHNCYEEPSWGFRFTYSAKVKLENFGWDFVPSFPFSNGSMIPASDYCTWYGITCQKYSHIITALDLSGINLRGTLPSSLGNFHSLASLDVSSNVISSTIPSSFFNLQHLTSIDLSNNGFIGSLSNNFNQLPRLNDMDLSKNNFQGSIPSSLLTLTSLLTLDLSSNQFSGEITSLISKSSLIQSIKLDSNLLSGKLGVEYCDWFVSSTSNSLGLTHNPDLTCYPPCLSGSAFNFFHDSDFTFCNPTSSPTSFPTNPSSEPTSQPTPNPNFRFATSSSSSLTNKSDFLPYYIFGPIGAFALLLVAYFIWRIRSSENVKREARLQDLPIHKALLQTSAGNVDLNQIVLQALKSSPKTVFEQDFNEKTALDCLLFRLKQPKFSVSVDVIYELLLLVVPFENIPPLLPTMNSNQVIEWLKVIQTEHHLVTKAVERVLENHKAQIEYLALTKDADGRIFRDVASSTIRKAMNKNLFLWGRFDLVGRSPVHKSPTSLLFLCMDRAHELTEHQDLLLPKTESNQAYYEMVPQSDSSSQTSSTELVALKFMMYEDQFRREVDIRANAQFNPKFVLGIQENFSPRQKTFLEDSILKGFGTQYPYCILMEAASGDLKKHIDDQNFAGEDFEEVRRIIRSVLQAVSHMHEKGFIHGDLKPKNIVRTQTTFKLIDLDASVSIGDVAGVKYSSAYLPPEMFLRTPDSQVEVRNPQFYPDDQLVRATPSFDIWSLGVLLYLLSTGSSLFHSNVKDNINDSDDLEKVIVWSSEAKLKKLANIPDLMARNLASQMLNNDPLKRPPFNRLFLHSFFTGKQAIRLIGEQPEFDVFLSYRVWSDKDHVAKMYHDLTALGVKVWWDAKCLKDGENWEHGFCKGLANSRFFVPFLSKNALSNFAKLTEYSPCDNVLLEHRLALELKEIGLINGIFPIVMGDVVPGTEPTLMKIQWGPEGWIPECSNECVNLVEAATCEHMSNLSLGTPLQPNRNIHSIMTEMKKMQGALIDGEYEIKMKEAVDRIHQMVSNKT